MNRSEVCGWIVVRKPDASVFADRQRIYRDAVPRLGKALYSGIERMPWYDLDYAMVHRSLPDSIAADYANLIAELPVETGVPLVSDVGLARRLHEHTKILNTDTELIAVRSPELAAVVGSSTEHQMPLQWIGFDAVEFSFWSVLLQGLYLVPDAFDRRWQQCLNDHGLFHTSSDAVTFGHAYLQASLAGRVEPLPVDPAQFTAIEVGRVDLSE